MKIDQQIEILTAYRDGVAIEQSEASPNNDQPWRPVAKLAHQLNGNYHFDFERFDYRIAPPRFELWIVWSVTKNAPANVGPFVKPTDATKKAAQMNASRPPPVPNVAEERYTVVRVHTDACA